MQELTRIEAAQYLRSRWGLRFSGGTLANLAGAGVGPAYRRAPRKTFYLTDALDDFAKARLAPLLEALTKHARERHDDD